VSSVAEEKVPDLVGNGVTQKLISRDFGPLCYRFHSCRKDSDEEPVVRRRRQKSETEGV
jgi:hypothetical protein